MPDFWIDKGDHFLCSVGGKVDRCQACSRPLEYSKERRLPCHHCPDAVETARQSWQDADERQNHETRSYHGRLRDGFRMLDDDEIVGWIDTSGYEEF